jgi:predicted metal-dependent peptidase
MNQELVSTKVDEIKMKHTLEWSIQYLLGSKDGYAYLGNILQCMTIQYSNALPTLGVAYNYKTRLLNLLINPDFFVNKLTDTERVAVLKHEMEHILDEHVFFDCLAMGWDKKLANVAMDLGINQRIKGLPVGALDIAQFRTKDHKPFPPGQSTEIYYNLLNDDGEVEKPNEDGQGSSWVKVKDALGQGEGPETLDSHDWDNMGDVDKGELMKAVADLMRRAQTKASSSYSPNSSRIQEILEKIEAKLKALNYKAILLMAVKKSLPAKFSRRTWKKPSRRYGSDAKGKLKAKMPKLDTFIDTSGSISVEEANEFLSILNNFLTVGVQSALVHLFHTQVYFSKKVKKNFKVLENEFQSGGTDLQDCFDKLSKSKSDLAIFITDGYYDTVNLPKNLPNVVFIISKGGTVDHPLKHVGVTVKYGD